MKAQALLCAALAGTFGFGSLAVAQDGGRRADRQDRLEQRQERREARQEHRQDRRELRQDRRQDRQQLRAERRDDRRDDRRVQRGHPGYDLGYHGDFRQPRYVQQAPRYTYSQPTYVYTQPRHTRFHRGGYLPYEYRNHGYYVSNWNAYPGLYAPPYGHQWVQVGSDFLLVALATGLIANLLTY